MTARRTSSGSHRSTSPTGPTSVRFLVGQLMGPMASGDAPPAWKPKHTGKGDDESAIATMVDHLGLDEADYDKTVKIARELLEAPDVKAAHDLLCHALERVPAMTGNQIEELLGPHLERIRPEGVADAAQTS